MTITHTETKLNRHSLEKAAQENVCACWSHTLAQSIDETDDETLYGIIGVAQYCHFQEQKINPVPEEEFLRELAECASA